MLVERESVLASLTALLDEAATGNGRLVFLGGEAGVGKTALAGALVDAVADGITVRRGGCDNLMTAAALGPIIDAVPELADALDTDAGVDRLRLFRQLRGVLSTGPTLLILEDVHWADEATMDLLRVLGRRLPDLSVLVLATFREDELSRTHPLTVVLGDLATLPGVVRMQLLPLTVAGVRHLIDEAGSALDAAELHSNTGGNPFYVTEVLAGDELQMPPTVRDAILARAQRLSAPARHALAAAAILGPRSAFPVLSEVCGEPPAAIDECVEHGVLVADETGVAFRHELARRAIEQTLSPGERAVLHAAALRTLRGSAEQDDRRMAHHAAGCGDRQAVLEHAPRAAAHAGRLGAHREAAELYRVAIRGEPTGRERAELFAALSYECYLTDQVDEALTARVSALQLFEQLGDVRAVGGAQRWLSRLCWFLGRNEDGERWAERAVATLMPLGPGPDLAMAYSNVAQLRMLGGDTAEAVHWGERAIDLARAVGDPEVEIHALNNVGTALMYGGDAVEGEHRLARSLDMAVAADLPEHVARGYTNLGGELVICRRFPNADRYLRAGIAYCVEHDLDSWRLYMSSWLARSQAEQGRYDAAESLSSDVLRRAHVSPITRLVAAAVAGQLAIRRDRSADGHFSDALDIAKATGEAQRLVPVAVGLAEAVSGNAMPSSAR